MKQQFALFLQFYGQGKYAAAPFPLSLGPKSEVPIYLLRSSPPPVISPSGLLQVIASNTTRLKMTSMAMNSVFYIRLNGTWRRISNAKDQNLTFVSGMMNEKSSFLCSALPWAAERCLRVCQRLASHLTTANRPFRLLSSSTKNYPSPICLCLCLSVLMLVSFVSSSGVCLHPFVSLCLTGCFIFCLSLPVYVAVAEFLGKVTPV